MASQKKAVGIDITAIQYGCFDACILGTTPLIINRVSEKGMRELLQPSERKNSAQKASTAKHDPFAEFRASPYTDRNLNAPTLLQHLSAAFKGAMANAALDLPGTNKQQIGRLTWVLRERVHIFGKPKIFSSIVRMADINRTPDIRTRVIIPEWACKISVEFVKPLLKEVGVANLLASAGITQGIGDWRTGKGKGTYGCFKIVNANDAEWNRVVKLGRKVQVAAMEDPEPYDQETEELLEWWQREVKNRGFETSAKSVELEEEERIPTRREARGSKRNGAVLA